MIKSLYGIIFIMVLVMAAATAAGCTATAASTGTPATVNNSATPPVTTSAATTTTNPAQPLESAVNNSATPSVTPSAAATTTSTIQPLEVVSVTGPLTPVNPGGPVIALTLKNISNEAVASLTATLELNKSFVFNFDVSQSNLFQAGTSIINQMTLINGAFDSNASYPLTVQGTFQDGSSFSFTEQIKIVPPAPTTSGQ